MSALKTVLKTSVGALITASIIGGALWFSTRGEYPVAALVTEDQTLPSARIAGHDLHLRIVEEPADVEDVGTVIVLHGGPGGDFRSLEGLGTLSDRHRVVFYDQRGAGLSERVASEALTLEGYLDELEAVIAHVAPEAADRPVTLVGHSWGAMLAVAYLGRAPEAVERAVLIEPGYLDAEGRAQWAAQAQSFMSGGAYWQAAVLNGFRAAHVIGPDAAAPDDFLIGQMVQVFANHPDNPYHCGEGYDAPGWRFGSAASGHWAEAPAETVDQIALGTAFQGPVLFLAGACNAWLGERLQQEHAARFENAKLAVIPEAGHDVVWDNPSATLQEIRAFLSE